MRVIIGLGNPGNTYQETPHNAGFWFIDHLAKKWNIAVATSKFQSLIGKYQDILLVKPQTFMNNSGEAVHAILKFYKLTMADCFVVYDDLDLEIGKLRVREQGSSGGHNGIKSIIAHGHTEVFTRLKIGIGRPLDKNLVTDYVLTKMTADKKAEITKVFAEAETRLERWLTKHV